MSQAKRPEKTLVKIRPVSFILARGSLIQFGVPKNTCTRRDKIKHIAKIYKFLNANFCNNFHNKRCFFYPDAILFLIVLVKVAYYATCSAHFLPKLCHLFLKLFLLQTSETSPKNVSRSCSNTFFGVTSTSFIVFCFLCFKATVSGYVCWFWYGL